MSTCPARETLKQLLDGAAPEAQQAELSGHLESCPACREALDQLATQGDSLSGLARGLGATSTIPEPGLGRLLEQTSLPAASDPDETQAEQKTADEEFNFLGPPARPENLGRIDHYEILSLVGKGGMGMVFKAFDESLHRVVAIKTLAPQLASSGSARNRFIREAKAGAAIRDEHVVDIHAIGGQNSVPYIVMEYVRGASLQEVLDQQGPLEIKEILRIAHQTAHGLAAAHAQGLIHRDIKPANILLENGVQRVKITDFGLARTVDDASMTQSGMVAGTPMYMAPEQAAGETLDHRADLFSLGSVLYAMCTGRPPFRASGSMAVLKRVCEDTPRPIRESNPEVPQVLADLIARLHAKKPADRPQSAKEVADFFAARLAELQTTGRLQPAAETVAVEAARPVREAPRARVAGAEALRSPGASPAGAPPASRWRRWALAAAALAVLAGMIWWLQPHLLLFVKNSAYLSLTGKGATEVEWVLQRDGEVVKNFKGLGFQRFELEPGEYALKPTNLKHGSSLTFEVNTTGLFSAGTSRESPGYLTFKVERGEYVRIEARVLPPSRHELKPEAPPLAVAPFDAAKAKEHQDAWAKHLGVEPEITNSIGTKLRLIPPGEYTMGTELDQVLKLLENMPDAGIDDPVHVRSETAVKVRLTEPFYMGTSEVTNAEFAKFVAATGYQTEAEKSGIGGFSHHAGGWVKRPEHVWKTPGPWPLADDHPVVHIGWNDAQAFCQWLSEREGIEYSLPQEKQWEFAARAGSTLLYGSGDNPAAAEKTAWTRANSKGPQPVAQKTPNAFGLYDMLGNVWELCLEPNKNFADSHVIRGGVWYLPTWAARPAFRAASRRGSTDAGTGFRVIASCDKKKTGIEGWVQLFNGKDLAGWKLHPLQKGDWQVEKGILVGRASKDAPVSHLFSERADFANFHLRIETMLPSGDKEGAPDSGLFFRCEFGFGFKENFPQGYEAQMCPNQTAGNLKSEHLTRLPNAGTATPGAWFTQEVMATANHIVIKVNGVTTLDVVDDHPSRFLSGHLALQAMNPGTVVNVRKIEIKELPAEPPPRAVAPFDAAKAKDHQVAWAKHLGVPVELKNPLGMEFRLIPPGEFLMGSTEAEVKEFQTVLPHMDFPSETPQRRMRVAEPFYLASHETTRGLFKKFVEATKYRTTVEANGKGGVDWNPEAGKWEQRPEYTWRRVPADTSDDHPVGLLTLSDAQAFCKWLSEQDGRTYVIPTEAQWEYACRAGTTTSWPCPREEIGAFAWYGPNSGAKSHPVGEKKANAFGLFDMLGNWEEITISAEGRQVIRGGMVNNQDVELRPALRFMRPEDPTRSWGFRVAVGGDLKEKGPAATPAKR